MNAFSVAKSIAFRGTLPKLQSKVTATGLTHVLPINFVLIDEISFSQQIR